MARKKQFGVPAELSRGFADTIAIIENNEGKYKTAFLPIKAIKLDPVNPRKLNFTIADASNGLDENDPTFKIKMEEKNKLLELAETIKSSGLINPIVVFKSDDLYQVVAGERRLLASILAGKTEIEARIFKTKPKAYSLKLLQWVENTSREDLTLYERVENIRDIFSEYKKNHPDANLSTGLIEKITGLANGTASSYYSILNCPETIYDEIRNGKLNSLDKAVLISNINDNLVQNKAIALCKEGTSLKALRQYIKSELSQRKQSAKNGVKTHTTGRKPTKVSFGSTNNIKVAKKLLEILLKSDDLKNFSAKLPNKKINDMRDASEQFKKLLVLLEKEVIA